MHKPSKSIVYEITEEAKVITEVEDPRKHSQDILEKNDEIKMITMGEENNETNIATNIDDINQENKENKLNDKENVHENNNQLNKKEQLKKKNHTKKN